VVCCHRPSSGSALVHPSSRCQTRSRTHWCKCQADRLRRRELCLRSPWCRSERFPAIPLLRRGVCCRFRCRSASVATRSRQCSFIGSSGRPASFKKPAAGADGGQPLRLLDVVLLLGRGWRCCKLRHHLLLLRVRRWICAEKASGRSSASRRRPLAAEWRYSGWPRFEARWAVSAGALRAGALRAGGRLIATRNHRPGCRVGTLRSGGRRNILCECGTLPGNALTTRRREIRKTICVRMVAPSTLAYSGP